MHLEEVNLKLLKIFLPEESYKNPVKFLKE